MVIAIIILSWLLINTFLIKFALSNCGCFIKNARGVIVVLLCIVFNVFVVVGVFLLCEKINKAYRRYRGTVRVPLWKKIVLKFKKR